MNVDVFTGAVFSSLLGLLTYYWTDSSKSRKQRVSTCTIFSAELHSIVKQFDYNKQVIDDSITNTDGDKEIDIDKLKIIVYSNNWRGYYSILSDRLDSEHYYKISQLYGIIERFNFAIKDMNHYGLDIEIEEFCKWRDEGCYNEIINILE